MPTANPIGIATSPIPGASNPVTRTMATNPATDAIVGRIVVRVA